METNLKPIGGINRRRFLGVGALGVGALALAACGSGAGKGVASAATAPPSTPTAPTAPTAIAKTPLVADVYLTVLNPVMTGKKGWPAYLPTDITIPAHSPVNFVITNFDDATPISEALAQVTGTVENVISVESLTPGDPNAAGQATVLGQVDPKQVSHTFTAPGLGNLNVPVPGTSRVRFTIQTDAPGAYVWQCLDPCGTGPDGSGGPMAPGQKGYMTGTITVA